LIEDLATSSLKPEWFSGVNSIVHLAALAHTPGATAADYTASNLAATRRLAIAAAEAGVKRFVFVSTIKVNGEATEEGQFFRADDKPAPQDAYAISKWQAEQALWDIATKTGLEVCVIRPPLVYGPKVKANFAALIKLIKTGSPLPLAAIANRRSMLAVDNLADLLIHCSDHPLAAGRSWLASDGNDLSTPELLQLLGRAVQRPARLFTFPPAILRTIASLVGKVDSFDKLCDSLQVDSSPVRQELAWRPPLSVELAFSQYGESWR
jgi:nucleoside-diphosphate-sugar epimerase